jgi:hypothetical protein
MPIDFPTSPTNGQTYSYGGINYTYNGTTWTSGAAGTSIPFAPINSPVFTGDPQAPTPVSTDDDTSVATTAFVKAAVLGATGGFPVGTLMLFQQSAAPAGWTKQTTHNDKALRVVSGAAGSGGSVLFSTLFGRTATDAFTLTTAHMPSHGHSYSDPGHIHSYMYPYLHHYDAGGDSFPVYAADWTTTGGAGIGIGIVANGSGGSHSHAMDNRVQYVDIIIARKD